MKSSKNHSHNKLNGKQQLPWSRFAFITRNMGHNTATMSASMGARSGQNSMNRFYQYRINITFCSLMVISTLRIILHVLHLIFYFCEVWNSWIIFFDERISSKSHTSLLAERNLITPWGNSKMVARSVVVWERNEQGFRNFLQCFGFFGLLRKRNLTTDALVEGIKKSETGKINSRLHKSKK